MKLSFLLIAAILVASVMLPFVLFVFSSTKSKIGIKKQANLLIKDNGITYKLKDIWRNNFIAISQDNLILTYLQCRTATPNVAYNINLKDVSACNIVKNYNNFKNAKGQNLALKSLALEFVYKLPTMPNTLVTFFDVDEDINEDFELQRIEKWHALIKEAVLEHRIVRMAS
ncbi:MAG: hypothetical protein ACK5NB_07730 [Flavobacteriaceae bacterium]